ncbi:hypothetical protein XPN_2088 [Xanthomonas arboricola pv. pruni MAFF 301427]|nr:hypothetical protein XPN_2088 [Xanthomonas arboricola pv. pruni MAFF 301427]
MDDHEKRYAVTVYVAAAGTPLMAGGTSFGGHMYYSIDDGTTVKSYGFSPIKHGEASGPGKVSFNDVDTYQKPYYSRTMEIDKAQYEKLEPSARPLLSTGSIWNITVLKTVVSTSHGMRSITLDCTGRQKMELIKALRGISDP